MKQALFMLLLIVSFTGCTPTQSFPPENQVLARNTTGGWLNIDFIHTGTPIEEAQRCVRSHGSADAVACFAFASEEAYQMTQPIEAGNSAGQSCWDARWQRNKMGTESGGMNNSRPSSCPPSEAAAAAPVVEDSGQVLNGRFQSSWFSRQGRALPAGVYEVGVTVPFYNSQPESVQRRLGPGLELMTGPLVEQASLDFMGKVVSIQRELEIQ